MLVRGLSELLGQQGRAAARQPHLLRAVDRRITWEKPLLGRHAIDGQDTNTLIVSPDANEESTLFPSIMLDPIETDHSRRFKKVHVYRVGRRGMGLGLATSGNGLDWTRHPANPIIPEWAADCQVLTYDSIDEKYVLWGRYGDSAGEAWHPEFDHWFAPVWPSQPRACGELAAASGGRKART